MAPFPHGPASRDVRASEGVGSRRSPRRSPTRPHSGRPLSSAGGTSEAAFDAWALTQCGRPVPAALAQAAASTWLTDSTLTADTTARGTPSLALGDLAPDGIIDQYADGIADVARRGRALEGAGGVVIDATAGAEPGIRYLRASSPEAVAMGLTPLISWCTARGNTYLAYAVVTAAGVTTGITNVGVSAGLRPTSSPANADRNAGTTVAATTATPAQIPTRPASSTDGESVWAVVVASVRTQEGARARAASLRGRAEHIGSVSVVAAPTLGRYRVTVGPYPSVSVARRALEELGEAITEDAWILAS